VRANPDARIAERVIRVIVRLVAVCGVIGSAAMLSNSLIDCHVVRQHVIAYEKLETVL
jgi:hypothetical protein